MRHDAQIIIYLQVVDQLDYLFEFVARAAAFLVYIGRGGVVVAGALEYAVGDAQKIILAAGDEFQVGAQAQFGGIAQFIVTGQAGAGLDGAGIAYRVFAAGCHAPVALVGCTIVINALVEGG